MSNKHSCYVVIGEDDIPLFDPVTASMQQWAMMDDARAEAIAVSRAFPGQRFWIYEKCSPPIRTELGPTRIVNDGG